MEVADKEDWHGTAPAVPRGDRDRDLDWRRGASVARAATFSSELSSPLLESALELLLV